MKFNTLTLIASAMSGVKQTKAAYTLFNGTDTGFCLDSQGRPYTGTRSQWIGTDVNGDGPCTQFTDHTYPFSYCSDWCDHGCYYCICAFDQTVLDNNLNLNNCVPKAFDLFLEEGVGSITSTGQNEAGFLTTCYVYNNSTSTPSAAPVTSIPTASITSSPSAAPITTSPSTATTSAPTGKPIAITSTPTSKPIAVTSAPTGKPIAISSAPTSKPTVASKSSKSVKATKVPSAKSTKNAKLA